MKFSLRQLLIASAFVAFGCASLIWANGPILAIWQFVLGISVLGAIIVSIFDRGVRQAFAIGFLIVAVAYNANVRLGQRIGEKLIGQSPTVMRMEPLLLTLWTAVKQQKYRAQTAEEWTSVRPTGSDVMIRDFPDPHIFNSIGVDLFSLGFGCLGGWFATFVVRRRKAIEA